MSEDLVCDGCGTTLGVRLVEVADPDGLITTCDTCEPQLRSEIVREVDRGRGVATDGGQETRETHIDAEDGLWIPPDLRADEGQVVIRTPRATIQHWGGVGAYYGMVDESHFGDPEQWRDPKNPELAPVGLTIKVQGQDPVELVATEIGVDLCPDGGHEATTSLFDRWLSQASENIDEWGLQDQETLLLAIQEELGELTQAYLEATHEGGDQYRVDKELDDLGALLLQFHESRNNSQLVTDGGSIDCALCDHTSETPEEHEEHMRDLHDGTARERADRLRTQLERSRMDIVVKEGPDGEVFVKEGQSILLLDRTEARIVRDELTDVLEGDSDVDEGRGIETDGGSRTVWYAAQGNTGVSEVYHTDPDCVRLQNARKTHDTTEDQLRDRRSLCRTCAGGTEQSDPDWSYQEALKDAAADEGRGIETDGGLIDVCPDCDSAKIAPRSYLSDHDYHCEECGSTFDDPVEREPKRSATTTAETILKRYGADHLMDDDADVDEGRGIETDGGEVMACPECDRSDVHPRTNRYPNRDDEGAADYRCEDCGALIDEPVRREPHNPGIGARAQLERLGATDLMVEDSGGESA